MKINYFDLSSSCMCCIKIPRNYVSVPCEGYFPFCCFWRDIVNCTDRQTTIKTKVPLYQQLRRGHYWSEKFADASLLSFRIMHLCSAWNLVRILTWNNWLPLSPAPPPISPLAPSMTDIFLQKQSASLHISLIELLTWKLTSAFHAMFSICRCWFLVAFGFLWSLEVKMYVLGKGCSYSGLRLGTTQ